MKKIALAGLVAAALTTACNQTKTTETATTSAPGSAAAADSTKGLNGLFASFWEKQSRLDPLSATAQGDNRFNDQLPNDQTQAYRDTLRTFYQDYLTRLGKFDRAALDENDKISYDIFQYDLKQRVDGLKLNTWMLPFQQFWGLPISMGQFGSGQGNQPFKTVQDYDNWLGRVRGFTVWADSAIGNFRRGMKAGVVLPRALVVKMIPQMRAKDMQVTDPTKSLFYGPINAFPKDFSDADKKRITEEYKKAILTEVVPTYKKLGDFLANEYLPKSRATSGINAVPGGPEIYRYYASYWTTTDKTPAEIHALGLREVARLRAEMERMKTQLGFKGTLRQFFESLKHDPKAMPFKTAEEVLAGFRKIQETIDPNLKKMFGRVPKSPFEIRRTEAFREASASAEYNQGSPDGTRPGIFYVPLPKPAEYNVTQGMESLFLHEAIPGHHYQISLQQENTSLPKFRQFAGYGAMTEGWALYCESLGKELGLYKDPYQYVGALNDEMLRAVRLVVDTGLHTGQLTREQAIAYMLDNMPASEDDDTSAIERYMAIPGQALAYKIGQLKIQELRARYEKQLGSKFKLSDFHDELLKDGVMPLAVLETKMDAWAKKQ
ncbi:DUF885 domain-containing protein [Hymenobacter sp. DH14]|uniref:DUF885 domain-containing protein n=1 Tax=Hymenobacter cyanobacteriorum TaxID=2926463 RepID=A0A9X2AEB7_9BACT|nr:DUF885 domain-containing protein [Hymenobacter cyanobacteriorum]MCI1187041.1 DUF885 domain-containing protein [Hymenobacter cyanobacteriorum]